MNTEFKVKLTPKDDKALYSQRLPMPIKNTEDLDLSTHPVRPVRPRPVYPPCETCGKSNQSTEKCYFRANAANRSPPLNRRRERQKQVQQRNAQINSDDNVQAAAQTLN